MAGLPAVRAYAPLYWAMWIINALLPQLLWFRSLRRNGFVLFIISSLIFVGMWIERFVLIVTSLAHDFLPSSWHDYMPTWVDWGILLGTLAHFMFWFLLFVRFVPFVPIHEVKKLRWEYQHEMIGGGTRRREVASSRSPIR